MVGKGHVFTVFFLSRRADGPWSINRSRQFAGPYNLFQLEKLRPETGILFSELLFEHDA